VSWTSATTSLGAFAVAALSLLLTYRARRYPYQEKIYSSQLEAASNVMQAFGKLHDKVQSLLSSGPPGESGGDFNALITEDKADFSSSYRQWSVVLPSSVSLSLAKYMEALNSITCSLGSTWEVSHAESIESRMSAAYTDVLTAARQSLRVNKLTTDNLRLIESLGRDAEPDMVIDPFRAKNIAEKPLFDNFVDEGEIANDSTRSATDASTLRIERNDLYIENRNLFIIHTWRPSARRGQVADISIRLTEHMRRGPKTGQASTERPLTDRLIEKVEYDLGTSWKGPFIKSNVEEDFRLDVSAYGPSLCAARVYFNNGYPPITIYRYLDFISTSAEV